MKPRYDGRLMTGADRRRLHVAIDEAVRREQAASKRPLTKRPRGSKAGSAGGTAFRRLLLALPDLIADAAERGLPVHVVFPEPLSPSAEALLRSLGASWEIAPERPKGSRPPRAS